MAKERKVVQLQKLQGERELENVAVARKEGEKKPFTKTQENDPLLWHRSHSRPQKGRVPRGEEERVAGEDLRRRGRGGVDQERKRRCKKKDLKARWPWKINFEGEKRDFVATYRAGRVPDVGYGEEKQAPCMS